MSAPKHYVDRPTIAQYALRLLGFVLILIGIALVFGGPLVDLTLVASGPTTWGWTNWTPLTGNMVYLCIILGLIIAAIGVMLFGLFGPDPIARRQIRQQRRIEQPKVEGPNATILPFPTEARNSSVPVAKGGLSG